MRRFFEVLFYWNCKRAGLNRDKWSAAANMLFAMFCLSAGLLMILFVMMGAPGFDFFKLFVPGLATVLTAAFFAGLYHYVLRGDLAARVMADGSLDRKNYRRAALCFKYGGPAMAIVSVWVFTAFTHGYF